MSKKMKSPAATTPTPPVPPAAWVNHKALKLWDDNPRDNEAAVPKVMASIERFGFVAPVVIWTSRDMMVAGNTRFKAFTRLSEADPTFTPPGAPGPGLVPVRYHEFANEDEARAYAIADNRLGYEADWDYEKLAPMLSSFQGVDTSLLAMTGFDPGELDALLRSQWSPDFVAPDNLPVISQGHDGQPELPQAAPAGSVALVFDKERWDVLKEAVQGLTGAGDTPSEIADGLFDLVQEMGSRE
jgi:hypothetical protein